MRYLSAVLLLLAVACRPQARPIPPIPLATPSASSSPSQFVPGPVPSPTPSPPSPLVASVERALQHDRVLSVDIGPRVSGTPGEKAAADYLNKALTEAGLEVRRQRFTRTDGGESENIIGRIPGVDYSTGYFVIGGHYDTVVGSPGGNDNGSGTALTVAIAEVVSKRSLPVEFIAFASEERHPVTKDHHQGSKAYVAALAPTSAVKAMISVDMIGNGPQVLIVSDRRNPSHLQAELVQVAQLGSIPFATRSLGAVSDHTSFTEAAIPGILLWSGKRPEFHTKGDTFETVQAEALDRAARLIMGWIELRFGLTDA